MVSRTFGFFASVALMFVSTNSSAHALLMNPPPVTSDDGAKSGPCGCYFGAAPEDPNEDASASACPAGYKTTSLEVGSKITVMWKETVNHNGKFRVALSPKAINLAKRADLDANVLYEADDTNGMSGGTVSTEITVPDTPCTNCVLQLRQFMAGAATPYYYSCAAIDIVKPASGSSSSSSSSSSSGSGTGGDGGAGGNTGNSGSGGNENVIGAGPAPIDQPQVSGACSMQHTTNETSSSWWLSIVGVFVLAKRRKGIVRA